MDDATVWYSIKSPHQLNLYSVNLCIYLQYVNVTGGISNKCLGLFGGHRLGETSALFGNKKKRGELNRSRAEERFWHILTVRSHCHKDDAGLCDGAIVELVEAGVWVIVEILQLLIHVVQLQGRPERLGVEGAVHWRRVKLENSVVLTQSVLDELRETWRGVKFTDQSVCQSAPNYIIWRKITEHNGI